MSNVIYYLSQSKVELKQMTRTFREVSALLENSHFPVSSVKSYGLIEHFAFDPYDENIC